MGSTYRFNVMPGGKVVFNATELNGETEQRIVRIENALNQLITQGVKVMQIADDINDKITGLEAKLDATTIVVNELKRDVEYAVKFLQQSPNGLSDVAAAALLERLTLVNNKASMLLAAANEAAVVITPIEGEPV